MFLSFSLDKSISVELSTGPEFLYIGKDMVLVYQIQSEKYSLRYLLPARSIVTFCGRHTRFKRF